LLADIITIGGSPLAYSRAATILAYARGILEDSGFDVAAINVRDLPTDDLIYGNFDSPAVRAAAAQIQAARGVIMATPVYKASYSGILKTFLDLLPQHACAGKLVLPIAIGGSPAHMLAIDYALRPVITALGGQHTLQGVYLLDSQIHGSGAELQLAEEAGQRIGSALHYLADEVGRTVSG
jgi:FMN reductase